MSEQLIKALRALPRYDYGYRMSGDDRVLMQYLSDSGPFIQHADLEAALSTHHAAPGAPQQEASGFAVRLGEESIASRAAATAPAVSIPLPDLGDPRWAAAPAGGVTDGQIDAVFAKWAGRNDHGAAYLRCYGEQFRHIARDILALTTAARAAEPTAETVKELMLRTTHEDRPGANLWVSTSVDEKVIALKVLKAYAASHAAATAPAGGVTDERAEFERQARAEGFPAVRMQPGDAVYSDSGSHAAWWGWKARAALTTAARAAEPAIHLGAEGQKVFAETLLNPPPPTAAFLKAEESYSNLVRPEATAPAGGMTDGAERWMAIVREKADDARKNAHGLRQFEGMEAEARARELAAQYLLETAHVMVLDERHAEALAGIVDQSGRIAELRAALTTAARAAEPAYHCIGFIEQYGRMIGDTQQGKQTIPVYVRAASPTPPTGTSKGEGTP